MSSITSISLTAPNTNEIPEDGFKKVCVARVDELKDLYDDEQFVVLEDGISFFAKWYEGIFFAGQKLEYRLVGKDEKKPTQIEIRKSVHGRYYIQRFPLVNGKIFA